MSAQPTEPQPSARSPAWIAYLLLATAALSWGGNAVSSRIAVGEISPMVLTTLRWLVAVVFFIAIAPRGTFRDLKQASPYWLYGIAMGGFGFTAFSAALYTAGHFTSAVNLALLQGLIPVVVLIGAYFMYGSRVDPISAFGVALTLAGVVIVSFKGDLAALLGLQLNFGDALVIVAAILYGVYTLFLRKRPPLAPHIFFAILALGAFVSSLPLLAGEMALGLAQWPVSWTGFGVLLFVGLVPSFLAQRCYIRGVELIGPGRAGLFVNLVPVFGALLSVLILGEPFGRYHAAALTLVLGGILIAERKALLGRA